MNTRQPIPDVRIYIIRHGETEWSRSGQHTGRTEIPLTPRGEEKARALGYHLAGVRFDHVLTSPRQRARMTCEFAGLGKSARVEPDLAEWDYGDYEGRRTVDIHREKPEWSLFTEGCPNGESPSQMAARVDRLISHLRESTGNIALFSHGHLSSVLAARWIGLPLGEAQHFPLGTASYGILGSDPRHPSVTTIALWNVGESIMHK